MTGLSALRPPCTHDTALAKVQAAEDAWNSRNPARVSMSMADTEDSEWRNRAEFLRGRDEIRAFLTRKWQKALNEMWEFDANGLMARRSPSINDAPIREDERRVHVPHPATGSTEVSR